MVLVYHFGLFHIIKELLKTSLYFSKFICFIKLFKRFGGGESLVTVFLVIQSVFWL